MKNVSKVLAAAVALLLLAACSGSAGDDVAAGGTATPASPTATPLSSSAEPVSSHPAEAGEPMLVTVAGYDYIDPTGPEVNACRIFSEDLILGCSVHRVTRLGEALFVQWQFNPDLVPPGSMMSGMATTFGQQNARVRNVAIAGEPVMIGTMPDGVTTIYAWEHEGVLDMLQSSQPRSAKDFVTQYVTELNA